jgi:hypothetical protein
LEDFPKLAAGSWPGALATFTVPDDRLLRLILGCGFSTVHRTDRSIAFPLHPLD